MGLYDFKSSNDRLGNRIRFLEKGTLRLKRGTIVGKFSKVSTASVTTLLVQDLTQVRKASYSSTAKRSIGTA